MGTAGRPWQWEEESATHLPRPSLKDAHGPALLSCVRCEGRAWKRNSAVNFILLTVYEASSGQQRGLGYMVQGKKKQKIGLV